MHEDIELNATGRVASINAELEADAYFPRIRSGANRGSCMREEQMGD